jgi:hypothetical protein
MVGQHHIPQSKATSRSSKEAHPLATRLRFRLHDRPCGATAAKPQAILTGQSANSLRLLTRLHTPAMVKIDHQGPFSHFHESMQECNGIDSTGNGNHRAIWCAGRTLQKRVELKLGSCHSKKIRHIGSKTNLSKRP